jgi:hypothetical protein
MLTSTQSTTAHGSMSNTFLILTGMMRPTMATPVILITTSSALGFMLEL